MITANNLHVAYARHEVLSDISFTIHKGDYVAVIGPNGAGKTTLMRTVLGLITPKSGSVTIDDRPPDTQQRRIGYVPQRLSIDRQFPGTVKELLHAGMGDPTHICDHLNINDLLPKRFVDCSGGQQQKVLVAMALQHDPDILILDEPAAGLDADSQTTLYELLAHLNTHHKLTILLVTHDILLPEAATHALCIDTTLCCYHKIDPAKDPAGRMHQIRQRMHTHGDQR